MVGGTNYKKQYEKNLERAVIRGDINLKQFHEKKANLHYRDMIGIDDGHSCCKGNIFFSCFIIKLMKIVFLVEFH